MGVHSNLEIQRMQIKESARSLIDHGLFLVRERVVAYLQAPQHQQRRSGIKESLVLLAGIAGHLEKIRDCSTHVGRRCVMGLSGIRA